MSWRAYNGLAYFVAVLISAGEVARFWGSARFIPMALDELLIAAALVWAASRTGEDRAYWHIAAWSAFCGLILVLLIETADHPVHGPVKEHGAFYLAALGVLLILGLWSVRCAIRLAGQDGSR